MVDTDYAEFWRIYHRLPKAARTELCNRPTTKKEKAFWSKVKKQQKKTGKSIAQLAKEYRNG